MNKKCICLICVKPIKIWVEFLSNFTNYDIFIIVDDNSIDYKNNFLKYDKINIIQVKNIDCYENGFKDINFCIKKKIIHVKNASTY